MKPTCFQNTNTGTALIKSPTCGFRHAIEKQLILMKNRCLICCFFLLFSLLANNLIAQSVFNDTVFFSSSSIVVSDLLDTIHSRTGINFSYDPTRVPVSDKVAVHFSGQTVNEVLSQIFHDIPVGFVARGRQIAIFRRNVPAGEITKNPMYIEIRGKVTDGKSRRPVPFASAVLSGTNTGTITNEEGVFSLKIPSEYLDSALTVSCVGYESISLPSAILANGEKEVQLNPVRISIREVVVRPTDPTNLITLAVKSVPERFLGIPVYLTGYFREITWKDDKCIALSESVTRIYKSSYSNVWDNDQIKLLKGRKQENSYETERISYRVEGGLFNSLLLDIAKNPASFLQEDYFPYYTYTFEGFTRSGDRDLYVISFDQKPGVQDALYAGKIFIDVASLSIEEARFGLSETGIKYARSLLIKKSPAGYNVRPVRTYYTVRYKDVRGGRVLASVHTELDVRARARRAFFNSLYRTTSDLVITGMDTSGVKRFRGNEISKVSDIHINQIKDYDPSFWEGFNTIEPEIRLDEAVARLQQKIRNQIPLNP